VSSNTAHKWRFGSRPKLSSKPTILCVDEDEELLRLRKGVLEEAGYAVLLATTGARALELLTDSPVSLVLSGHMVRATSGNALAAEMKRIKPEVPVVLYCGKLPDSLAHVDGFINNEESRPNFLTLIAGFVRTHRERVERSLAS
jgi:CheY-like chemotaxis protein